MPQAIFITHDNLDLIADLSGWERDPQCVGYYFVKDVQFPHGYVDQAIVTGATFRSTFKATGENGPYVSTTELTTVDYK